MKKNKKIALCGMISALSLVIMLASYIPYFTYAVPAAAGIVFCVIVIEIGFKYSMASYFCTAVLAFFLCEKEAAVLFVLFFGYYPILKAVIEKYIKKRPVEYLLKFLVFNVSIVVSYALLIFVFKLPVDDMGPLSPKVMLLLLLVAGNVAFWVYDIAITRLVAMYYQRLRKHLRIVL